ncbi:SUR7/PalI family protein [Hirsutella rhossiliensis]|uniref:SUR7/PalI family domain-containing protein n=1 Tax=Hirsutella rhossiliensis TaxID=111463 RepID=A0A9P8SL95_9HYPO|nr:SUR7/PalI family domain-containing protein [Hirsutella rhossiliensis]KAH0965585.1 SUR7/PalI family domain-containing protein [Hirsutella rhossiliensis]
MALVIRYIVILPLVLALASFVLTSLTLFAGHKQGFMEDYAIVRLNTSMIGQSILDKATGDKDQSKPKDDAFGRLKGWVDGKKNDVKEKLNGVVGNITEHLGVPDWYSLHIMNACEGQFEPNPTAPNPGLNMTNCTASSPAHRLNLTRMLDHDLGVGPVRVNLADMDWTESLQDKLDILNNALLALFTIYVLAMGFSGLSMLLNVGALLLPAKTAMVLVNLAVASMGGLACIIGSTIITVAGSKAVKHINEKGARVGLSAERGFKFHILGWVATGFMLAVTAFWLVQFLIIKLKARRRSKEGF